MKTMLGVQFHLLRVIDNYFIHISVAPVNVGWGKKETQFHGSLGKQAATSKNKVSYSNKYSTIKV